VGKVDGVNGHLDLLDVASLLPKRESVFKIITAAMIDDQLTHCGVAKKIQQGQVEQFSPTSMNQRVSEHSR
jgi:hypothetical protein